MDDIRQMVEDIHADTPQRLALAKLHLGAVEEGIQALAALGHRLELRFMDPQAPLQFPKMLYSDNPAQRELTVVNSEEEAQALRDGFRLTPLPVPLPVETPEPSPSPVETQTRSES